MSDDQFDLIGGVPFISTTTHDPPSTGQGAASSLDSSLETKLQKTPLALQVAISVINIAFVLIFLPINCRLTRGFLQISTKNQPMFLFFVGVQFNCIADLVACFVEVILLWVEVPDSICRLLGWATISTYWSLSFLIASICLYR